MKLKSGFVVREVRGKTMAVPTGLLAREFHGMITLNGTGRVIWDALARETDEAAIVARLLAEYEIDRETAERDVNAFVSTLREQKLLLE